MRALLEEWLRNAGYRVHSAASLSAPVQENADLVIVSIYMPKHAGARLAGEIRAAYPRTPLLAISGQFRSGLSTGGATAQTLGVAQVIAKPLTRDALLATVQMPGGIPVATMAIDKAGATNAAIFAAEILGTSDPEIARRLVEHKKDLARSVAQKNERLKQQRTERKGIE